MLLSSAAQAERRVALLIGNQAYGSEIGRLANPHNDVALLEKSLKDLGFEVATVRDAGLGSLTTAINAYARRVQAAGPSAVGFFYFSGHGAADAGTNYLIPVDVKTTETGELWDQSLRLTEITRKLKTEAGNATHFVVFDACRNTLKLTKAGSRAVVQSKGFVPVAQESGMLVAYATAEGELASDIGAGAGPYAKVLAEEIVKPGVEAVTMFRNVQRRVRMTIKQEPYLGFNALGDVYLAGLEAPKLEPVPEVTEAAREWARVDKTSVVELETFVRRHWASPEADYAKARIDAFKMQALAVATPPKAPSPAARCDDIEVTVGTAERKCMKAGSGKTEWFKDCANCPEMVVVPAGSFTMGSPKEEKDRSHQYEDQLAMGISKPFAVGRLAVTRGEFAAFVGATGYDPIGCLLTIGDTFSKATGHNLKFENPPDASWRSVGFKQTDLHPVVCINWTDAKTYVAWLSSTTGKAYRLPSETEREYVTRAGSKTAFWWGSAKDTSKANYDGTNFGSVTGLFRKATVAADSLNANPWGIYNVHGNVTEWTEDCWNETNAGNPRDGSARSSGDCSYRITRGGAWSYTSNKLRSASREVAYNFGLRDNNIGFRVARTLD